MGWDTALFDQMDKEAPVRPTLVMLCGPSCAGKSTARTRFTDLLHDPLVLNTDDFIETWAKDCGSTYAAEFKRFFPIAKRTYESALVDALARRRNLVLDRTHVTVASRREVLSQVPVYYTTIAVRVGRDVSLSELLLRNEKRADETGKAVPAEVIGRMWYDFVPPRVSEGFNMVLDLVE